MITRSKRRDHFTVVNNSALEDSGLSFRAKGVLVYLLSKPDDWKVSERQLARVGHEGVTAIRAALKELEMAGYIERRRMRGEGGKFEWESVVFETPRAKTTEQPCSENRSTGTEPCSENLSMDTSPCLGFPCVDKPCVDNRAQVNTVETKTVVTNTPTRAPAAPSAPPPPKPSQPPPPAANPAVSESDYRAVVAAYQNEIGLLTPIISDAIKEQLRQCPANWLTLAISIAVRRNNRRWSYVEGILRRWQADGFDGGQDNLAAGSKSRGNGSQSSKSAGYGRQEHRGGTSPRKGRQDHEQIDPDMAEFLAAFVDCRDGTRAIAAD